MNINDFSILTWCPILDSRVDIPVAIPLATTRFGKMISYGSGMLAGICLRS